MPAELKASEALAQHRNIIFRKALEKLKANEALDDAELTEVQRREQDDEKQREKRTKKTPFKIDRRQRTLTQEVITKICAIVEDGGAYIDAAVAIGIRNQTISEWLAKADSHGGIYAEFAERLATAKAKLKNWHAGNVNRLARQGSLTASLRYLEAHGGREWRPQTSLEHTGPNGTPLNQTNVAILYLPDNGRALPQEPEQPVIEVNGADKLLENGNGATNGNGH